MSLVKGRWHCQRERAWTQESQGGGFVNRPAPLTVVLNRRFLLSDGQLSDRDGNAMPKKAPSTPMELRQETREWLNAHTLADVRSIAHDLENQGEDVSDLIDAINELDAIVNTDPTRTAHRRTAKAEA